MTTFLKFQAKQKEIRYIIQYYEHQTSTLKSGLH